MIYTGEPMPALQRGSLQLTFVLFVLSTLAACGGSSSGNRTASGNGGGGTGLSLSASPTSVSSGGSTILSWSASNATSCEASGGWGGSRNVSGSETVGPIDSDTTFRLSCSGSGGGVSRQVTVTVGSGDGPSVTLRAQPEQVAENDSSTLTWSSQDVTSCQASGGWGGNRSTSGTFNTGPVAQTTTFSLQCSGATGNALASVQIEVLTKTLSWVKPTANEDGSELTDLAGFNVYWGSQSRDYGTPHTIGDPDTTQWQVTAPPGTYFFALTAFDQEGNESGYSNELLKTIP